MEIYANKLTDFPMSNMHRIGFLCVNKPAKIKILISTVMSCVALFCIAISIIQFFYIKKNIFDFVDNNEATAGYGQIFIKICYCAYNKDKFLNLIKITKQFWNTDNCSKIIKEEIDTLINTVVMFQKVFFYSILACSPIFTVVTFFGKKLPLGSWNMENQEQLYHIVWYSYVISLPYVAFFIATFDCLFLGLCYEIIVQFKILSNSLENLSVKNIQSPEDFQAFYHELRKHIQYHIFLLKFIKEVQKVYSIPFFVQYLTIAPLICTEIYATSESTILPLTLRYGFAGICLTSQLGFYCIASSLVFEEAMTVSYGIYNSDWYSKYFRQLQTPLVMLIQATQTELKFSACGLVPININTLASVMKVAFSASTVFKNLKE